MIKVLTLITLAIVTAVSTPIVQKADAETACHRIYRTCLKECRDDATVYACVDSCWAGKNLCNTVGWYWFNMRSAATASAWEAGVKDPSAAGASKLKASALATRAGAATATMPGAGAVRSAVTNSGKISTNATTVTNSGVIRRGSVAGHPVSGPASTTFRPQ